MDIALCTIDYKNNKLEYAGAFNPMVLIRNKVLTEVTGNKFPIGAFVDDDIRSFENHEIDLQKGDSIYVFTDGYKDQFGGEKNKKFYIKNFKELLLDICEKPMNVQREILNTTIENWMGHPDNQVDDILVIGVRI